jgi:tetratricopeptide (TPR) repeat protein/tRNA A-37 threonylcarbamoyl transferase component Bud32
MKTFSPGLSDSIAHTIDDPPLCPHCDSSSHIAGGLCVGCLLEAGLDPADEDEPDSLDALLSEINLPDQNWRLGNYEILEEIGRGGMGVIYRARQRHSRRIVAVKRILSYHSDSRETLARFRREAQAAASLDHPNILPIYEVSESEDGLPFFSMKFAPGGTLQQVAPALRNDPRQCVAIVAKIARAVQYAHSRGILHRDLKPGNILLDGRGEPLVSDFGLAKWLDTTSDLTRTLTIFGTPGYIAPEQASSAAAELKPTADVYSLGAILFDLLAGRPPFLGAHALSVIRQASESPAPKLRSLSKLADRDLETICSRCLDREPNARYRSAHDLAEDLERWLEGRPIIARPVSSPIKAWRWCRRNPVLALTLTGCVMLAGVTIAWQIRNRNLEAAAREQAIASHSIAVMPLLNLDDASDDSVLSASISSTLQRSLNRVGPGRVTFVSNPPAILDLKTVSAQYSSGLLLCGTVRTLGDDHRRVSLRLLDSDGTLLFRKAIESDSPDLVSEFLNQSAANIYASFSPAHKERTIKEQLDHGLRDTRAKEFILAGRELMQRQSVPDLDHALGCFDRAIQLEPKSALARAYFATTAGTRLHYAFDAALLDKAQSQATRALELNANLPEGHRALAGLAYHRGDLARALDESYQAIELGGPEVPMLALIGDSLKTIGQPHRAIKWFERMAQWSVRPAEDAWMIGDCWADLADDDRAESNYRRVSDFNPDLPEGWLGICRLRLLQGQTIEARLVFSQHAAQYKDHAYTKQMAAQIEFFARNFGEAERLYSDLAAIDPGGGGKFYGSVSYDSALGMILLARGEKEQGDERLRRALTYVSATGNSAKHPETLYCSAAIKVLLGQSEAAVSELEHAFSSGWIDYRSMILDPRFDSIRKTEPWQRLIQRMKERVLSLHQLAILKYETKYETRPNKETK